MKACRRNSVISPLILNFAIDGGEWSALLPGRLTLGQGALGAHLIGGWLDPRTGVDIWRREQSLAPATV